MTTVTLRQDAEDGGWVRLFLMGEIDLANSAELETQIYATIEPHVNGVVVDLSDVSYIDSAGVRVLVLLASRLELRRVGLRFVSPTGSLARRVVEITGLEALASDSA